MSASVQVSELPLPACLRSGCYNNFYGREKIVKFTDMRQD